MSDPTVVNSRKSLSSVGLTAKGEFSAWSNLRLVEIFVCVAEAGSMSTAAERLALTQPAISQAIATLEQAVGNKLFDRTVRPPVLTMFGTTILQYAVELVEKFQALQYALRLGNDGEVPLLRLGMINSFAATVGPFVLNALRDIATQWAVVSGFEETRMQELLERRVDFLVTTEDTAVPDELISLPIVAEPFFVAVPASYSAKIPSIKALAADLDMIGYGREAYMRARIGQYLTDAGVNPRQRYLFDTTGGVLRMVDAGMGWSIMTPLIYLKSIGRHDNVRAIPLPGATMHRRVTVMTRRGPGVAIAKRLQAAAIHSLRTTALPQMAEMLPAFATKLTFPKASPGT